VPVLIMVVGIPLIYPNGRLLSPRWRWLVAVLIWSLVTYTVREGLRPGLISDTTFENPFGVVGIEPLLDVLQLPDVFGVALFVGAIASVAIRYRRAGRVERQQLKWLIGATALSVVAWSVVTIGQAVGASTVVTIGWIFALLCFSALPIAIGIAVLRYRLYEIDRIISRTIAWALVTGVLVAVFASVVVMLQTALIGITQGQTLAVAASTLVALALFQPLRRRVQHAVDRRFDRARYDGERTVASFTGRLAGEVDLEALEAAVADTVRDALHPSFAELWVRGGPDRT
jgi:hypothetical protein